MKQKSKGKDAIILNKACVNKTWPKFWDFMNYCDKTFS